MTPFGRIPGEIERLLAEAAGTPSRRAFLQGSGLFAVSLLATPLGERTAAAQTAGPYPPVDFRKLDTWIVIHQDSTATFYVGKTDGGQGTGTAFRQLMCDELDLDYDKSTLIMGRTDTTPDQGGSGGSDALQVDAYPARRVAAEARRVLLDLASTKLGVPVAQLTAASGVIRVTADPGRKATYGELIGGRRFNVTLTGANINATTGLATLKPAGALTITGQPIPRYDIPGKVDGTVKWASGVQVPGMVHARNVRPPTAGATFVSYDEASVARLPGFIQVVQRGNYVAVVCEREEQAVAAARAIKVTWTKAATPPFPPSDDLYRYMRQATPTVDNPPAVQGNPDGALASAAKTLTASYDWPFQGHTAIGPAHALADWSNGQLTIYSNDMKSYGLRTGVAKFLDLPEDTVRVVWMDGPQVYGRTAADDAGFEAAFLAKTLGRPVRVQWMRHEETAWDAKGPAYTVDVKGGLDAEGHLVALDWASRAADHAHLGYNEPDTVLIAQLMGTRRKPASGMAAAPSELYEVPHRRRRTQVVGMPLVFESPLRTGNLRDPNGPQVTFAGESFIDELAAAAGADPVAFRLTLLTASTKEDAAFRRARSIA
ncbi:MAG: molybdopterin cofactor-binding domain-containing protein, partial [Vicinamibacterales bacterium]